MDDNDGIGAAAWVVASMLIWLVLGAAVFFTLLFR